MSNALSSRLGQLYTFLLVASAPLLVMILTESAFENELIYTKTRIFCVLIYLFALLVPSITAHAHGKFPALPPYVIRCLVAGCLMFAVGLADASPSDGLLYYSYLCAIILAVVLIGIGKLGAILGR
jgi:hypothetical protein